VYFDYTDSESDDSYNESEEEEDESGSGGEGLSFVFFLIFCILDSPLKSTVRKPCAVQPSGISDEDFKKREN